MPSTNEDPTVDERLKLAEEQSARKDDRAMMEALAPLAPRAADDSALRRRVLDAITLFDRETLCLDFAQREFHASPVELDYLKLQRNRRLKEINPTVARARLKEITAAMAADSELWSMAAQQFSSFRYFHAAIRAQKMAIKLAPGRAVHDLRLPLALMHTKEGNRFRARVQLLILHLRSGPAPDALRACRDFSVRCNYPRFARAFAATLCRLQPGNPDALIALSAILCRARRLKTSSRLASKAIDAVDGGGTVSRAAWPMLIEVLTTVGRMEEAETFLTRALTLYPRFDVLIKMRNSNLKFDELRSHRSRH